MTGRKTPFNKSRYFFDCGPDCEKRQPGCQSHCEKYLLKRAKLDRLNKVERERKMLDQYSIDQCLKHKDRNSYKRSSYIPED